MSRSWSWRHAILNSSLPATTRHVLLTISCHMNDLGEGSYPTTAQLAGETGLSERSVCTHIDIARKAGWIEVTKHGFGGQKWKNHEYRAHWPIDENNRPDDRKALNEVQHVGTEGRSVANDKALNLFPKGTEPDDRKALNEVQSSIPSSIPERSSLSETSSDETRKGKKRISYPEAFDALWKAYPTHQNMSKKEAFDAWRKLDAEDRAAVFAAVPGYKDFLAKKPDLERQHLCRFISRRRFDGYVAHSSQTAAPEQVSDEQWVVRLVYARREKIWATEKWGPRPGQMTCRVPEKLIQPGDGEGWREFENA